MDEFDDDDTVIRRHTFTRGERNVWLFSRFRRDVDICNSAPFILTFHAAAPVNLSNLQCEYAVSHQSLLKVSGRFMQQFYPSYAESVLHFPVHHYMSHPLPIGILYFVEVTLRLYDVPAEVESITLHYVGRKRSPNRQEQVTHPFQYVQEYEQSSTAPITEWRIPFEPYAWLMRIFTPRGLIAAYREHPDLVPEPMPIQYWNDHPYLHLPDLDVPVNHYLPTTDDIWHRHNHIDSVPVMLVLRFSEPMTRLSLDLVLGTTYSIQAGMLGTQVYSNEIIGDKVVEQNRHMPFRFWWGYGNWNASYQIIRYVLPLESSERIHGKFMRCDTCRRLFDYDVLMRVLREKPNCPSCRSDWTSPYVYKQTPNAKKRLDQSDSLSQLMSTLQINS